MFISELWVKFSGLGIRLWKRLTLCKGRLNDKGVQGSFSLRGDKTLHLIASTKVKLFDPEVAMQPPPALNLDLLSRGCGPPEAFREGPHISFCTWGDLKVYWGIDREELAPV